MKNEVNIIVEKNIKNFDITLIYLKNSLSIL